MKRRSFLIVTLVVASIALSLPVTTAHAWWWRPPVTKIAIWGHGIPGPDPDPGTFNVKTWDGVTLITNFKRDFAVTIWSEEYPEEGGNPDPRLTGTYKTEWTIFSYPDGSGGERSTTFAKRQTFPDAACGGWWTGFLYGKMWEGEDQGPPFYTQHYEFHSTLWGKGAFKGMTVKMTISTANFFPDGFEMQGYILTS